MINQHSKSAPVFVEPMVEARAAAYTMNLPTYFLTNAAQRTRLQIPHYRLGRLVRFKLSELAAWQAARNVAGRDRT